MKSVTPKVLHPIAGWPLLVHPLKAAFDAGVQRAVVVTSPDTKDEIERQLVALFGEERVVCVVQSQARGTGDAARVGLEQVQSARVLILCGDTPLLEPSELRSLVDGAKSGGKYLVFASCRPSDPSGYGRVLRGPDGAVLAIREHRDASPSEREITEVNAGVYCADTAALREMIPRLVPNNDQGELYLTDVVSLLAPTGCVEAIVGSQDVLLGVNDRCQLEEAEQRVYARLRDAWRKAGVTIRGDARIDATVQLEADAVIESGVSLRGNTRVGAGALVDTGCVVDSSQIAAGARLKPYSVVVDSQVGERAQIGPFAHLRPGSEIDEEAHIGNFVETKKTRVRKGAKANHLAYLGDGDVGEKANVGAGTIFCNYDGYRKHRTIIGANAFIGSDSQLVAPVTIGEGAYVATGTTVTKDVPAQGLAIGRTKQENKDGYGARLRARLAAAAGKKP